MEVNNTKNIMASNNTKYNIHWKNYDALYGPWNGIKEMIDTITGKGNTDEDIESFVKTVIPPGLTIGIVENDRIVEYWNPFEGQGFVKKKASDVVSDYSTATALATSNNAGVIVKVNNPETIGDVTYPAGFYIVEGSGVLSRIGTSTETIMNELDTYVEADEEEKNHTYVSNVTNKDGQIYPVKKDLDTEKILMSGNDEEDSDVYIEVMGTNVGGLSVGDIIKNGTSLDELLKMILQREIDVKIGGYPSVKLVNAPSEDIYEVGTKVRGILGYEFSNGYFVGSTDEYDTKQYAGCSVNSVTYRPSETYDDTIKLGDNLYSVSVTYTASDANGDKPLTNMGNQSSVVIPEGNCSDEKNIRGEYKFWYGHLVYDDETRNIISSETTDSMYNRLTSLTQGFTDGDNDVEIGTISNASNEMFCCFCPQGYELYGEQMMLVATPNKCANSYTYSLPNGTNIVYDVYVWQLVSQRYTNVKLVKK